jgi:molybdopterin converting factor subunit 1
MHRVKILFFASLRDYVGTKSVDLEIPLGTTIEKLTGILLLKFPHLVKVKEMMMVAINREYASEDLVIPEGAEIAFFPPVSGG